MLIQQTLVVATREGFICDDKTSRILQKWTEEVTEVSLLGVLNKAALNSLPGCKAFPLPLEPKQATSAPLQTDLCFPVIQLFLAAQMFLLINRLSQLRKINTQL